LRHVRVMASKPAIPRSRPATPSSAAGGLKRRIVSKSSSSSGWADCTVATTADRSTSLFALLHLVAFVTQPAGARQSTPRRREAQRPATTRLASSPAGVHAPPRWISVRRLAARAR
jgi:hypothetical protein